MGLLDQLSEALKDLPVSEVLRERTALVEAQYAVFQAENDRLTREVNRLAGENRALRLRITPAEFVEARGVLFKRRAGGGVDSDPYCPTCRLVLSIGPSSKFLCSKCYFRAPFNRVEIGSILESVEKQAPQINESQSPPRPFGFSIADNNQSQME